MFKNVVIILLLGIATFSMFKYVSELKAIFRLQDSLTQTQDQVAVLAQEKQNLLQELDKEKELKTQLALKNKGLKDYLKASKDRIARLFHDNEVIQSDREEVLVKFSILKAENQALIDRQKRLYLANEQFKSKLSSVVELKKAIRELKSRKHKAPDLIAEGNQGFLIKDGRSNDLGNIKIEVVPARTKE